MKYRNTKTGAVITTASVISGGDWVEVVEPAKKPKRTTKQKKDVSKSE